MATMLMIGDTEKVKIQALKEFAMNNIVTIDQVMQTIAGKALPVGDNAKYKIALPVGYIVVYSIEQQPRDRKARHISVSYHRGLPHPAAVNMILEEFDFKHLIPRDRKPVSIDDFHFWIEEKVSAINCLEFM